jgi:hypothetical protein
MTSFLADAFETIVILTKDTYVKWLCIATYLLCFGCSMIIFYNQRAVTQTNESLKQYDRSDYIWTLLELHIPFVDLATQGGFTPSPGRFWIFGVPFNVDRYAKIAIAVSWLSWGFFAVSFACWLSLDDKGKIKSTKS